MRIKETRAILKRAKNVCKCSRGDAKDAQEGAQPRKWKIDFPIQGIEFQALIWFRSDFRYKGQAWLGRYAIRSGCGAQMMHYLARGAN